jgi:hypothetical protein
MFLAPFMLGLSPTGMRRLPSGHGGQDHVDDDRASSRLGVAITAAGGRVAQHRRDQVAGPAFLAGDRLAIVIGTAAKLDLRGTENQTRTLGCTGTREPAYCSPRRLAI